MTPLRLGEGLLREAFSVTRACGAGERECVAYLSGPLDDADVVDEVVHPHHTASSGGYRVSPSWLHAFWLDLARRGREVRLQVHTHPGAAYHSSTDDELPLAQTAGFLSLVLPNFAQGPSTLVNAHLAELSPDGSWASVSPNDRLEVAS